MKKLLKSVGNFFKKIGLFIWKYLKIAWNYIKENAWIQPIAIVVLIFGLVFGIQGIINGVEKIKANAAEKEEKNNLYTKLTMAQVEQKLKDKESFVLFIGAWDCAFCEEFKPIINKYVSYTKDDSNELNDVYYIDIHDKNDYTLKNAVIFEWAEKLTEIDTRDFTSKNSLGTPTVIVIRDGEFKDAKSGAQGLDGGIEYLDFVKFVEGEFIGKVEPTR